MSDQSWACQRPLQGQMQLLQYAAGLVEPALGATAGLGWWFMGVAVLLRNAGVVRPAGVKALLGNHSAQSPASV